jgi:hypothetical protein
MKCTVETGSGGMIYVPNFMEIGTDVKVILRFCFTNLKGYNVGFIGVSDL